LGANQGQAVVVDYSPTVSGTNNSAVSLTGGGGASIPVSGVASIVPILPQYSFTNPATITINDASRSGIAAAATPYPSTITVAALSGVVSNVTAMICGYTHTYPHDVGVLLAGPKGQKIVLMADSCGWPVTDLTLTFDDYAATVLTEFPPSPIVSGAYKPSNCGSGDSTFPPGAPAGPYGSALSVCDGSSPNGVWSLYVQDDSNGDSGYINNGWVLSFHLITTASLPVITQQPLPQTVAAGSPASFTIIASNAQTYTWRMDGTELKDGGRFSGSATPNLMISNTLASDSGSEITCVVANSAGSETSSNALLTVSPSGTPWFSGCCLLGNGQIQLTLSGSDTSKYTIYFSSDLITWKTLTTLTPTNGSVTLTDMNTGLKQRFYRAMKSN
jgi:subtilisin-like proprotein convertase family protein